MRWDNLVADWQGLENAVKAGAKTYLDPNVTAEAGLVHGEAGKNRAQNVLQMLEGHPDHVQLIALMLAVYDPKLRIFARLRNGPSSWLATCIASRLIMGNYYHDSHGKRENTLRAPIFEERLLEASKNQDVMQTKSADTYSISIYDHHAGMRWMLWKMTEGMNAQERTAFADTHQQLSKSLTSKPAEESEMRTMKA